MPGWEEIRDSVRERIRVREWPPGALIPAEERLAADYGVARATVNRACGRWPRPG
jgi:GntR family histidine utilization transcriptional repressor